MTSLTMPSLTTVTGSLRICDMALSTVALPSFASAGDEINFEALPVVTSIALASLSTTPSIIQLSRIGNALPSPGPLTLDLSALTTIGGLRVQEVANLQRLGPFLHLAVVNGDISITTNESLADLPAPSSTLTVNGAVNITSNPALPTCSAKAFAAACSATGPTTVMGNKVDACGG